MGDQTQASLQRRHATSPDRGIARTVGILFLAGMVVYIVGNAVLVQPILAETDPLAAVSTQTTVVAVGAMLMLMAAAFDATHGIVILPVLRRRHERVAFGYLGARIIDSLLLAVGVMFLLLQIPLSREYLQASASEASALQALGTLSTQANHYAYELGMIAVGVAGLLLCYAFYQARLVPRPVAIWGLVGYATLFAGSVLTVLGLDLRFVHTIPGGLWELFIGVWLIAKGFNSAPIPPQRTTSTTPVTTAPTAGAPA